MSNIVILYSGGLDSMVMKKIADEENINATLVYYDIGQKYAHKEIAVLPDNCHVHDMKWFSAKEFDKDGNAAGGIYIPGRNMLFATVAACQYMPDEIWLGALMGEIHDYATDKNEQFRDKLNETFSYVLSPFGKVKLVFPFVERKMGKYEVVEYAHKLGMDHEILKSSSCMDEHEHKCGKCIVCARRWAIMMGIDVNLANREFSFEKAPIWHKETRDYYSAVLKDAIDNGNHYDSYRRKEIIPGLKIFFDMIFRDTVYTNDSIFTIQKIYDMLKDEHIWRDYIV